MTSEHHNKLEFERIEDLVVAAERLTNRALERLQIETGDMENKRILGIHARTLLIAAISVLERL
jgi:hypothetical protein